MRLIYNYQNGEFAISHSTTIEVMKTALDGAEEMVYIFDISHWTTDDFIYFSSLHADDQAESLERLNCISDTPICHNDDIPTKQRRLG